VLAAALLLTWAAFVAAFALFTIRAVLSVPAPTFEWRAPLDTGPDEPCWNEELRSDGRFHFVRSQCVHDCLMELDRRALFDAYPALQLTRNSG
jgi:hypothetical protein